MSQQQDNQNQQLELPLIDCYTRRQAIEDGVLVDVEKEFSDLTRQAGFNFPIAFTKDAFERYIKLNPNSEKVGESIKGRLWDVLWMLKLQILISKNKSTVYFSFLCTVPKERHPDVIECFEEAVLDDLEERGASLDEFLEVIELNRKVCKLKAVVSGDDEGEPCITIMLPFED